MVEIDGIRLEEEIATEYFTCDIKRCKGACCTFPGEFGAPLLDEEIAILKKCLPAASEYLSKKSLQVIKTIGITEGTSGNYSTMCINKRDCVFVFYENDVALCSLERAYFDGKINFRKPISCHLFPIRVARGANNYLYYEKISECLTAQKKGKQEKIPLYIAIREALIRAYGKNWYELLSEYIKSEK